MIAVKGLESIVAADPAVADRALDNPQTFVIQNPGTKAPYGTAVADFVSFASFERSIANGAIDPAVHWVMYDNEGWAATPDNEKAAPADYEARFAALAHAHQYKVILAPATNLVPGFVKGARVWPDYLNAGFPRFSAAVADAYDIQAQPWEGTPDYAPFVQAAVAQARQANPNVILLAGLCSCRVASGTQMLADVTATRGLLSGYWINLLDYGVYLDKPDKVAARISIAVDFLRTV
jgi:hypothetical protein